MKKYILLALGIIYYFLIQVNIVHTKHNKPSEFSFTLNSHISQSIKLQIKADSYEFLQISCNQEKIPFEIKGYRWFDSGGEQVIFNLHKGENKCQALVHTKKKKFIPIVKQKLTFFDYIVLFILLLMPIYHIVFTSFMRVLAKIKHLTRASTAHKYNNDDTNYKLSIFLMLILFIGALIRVLYFQKFGIMHFQHDWQGHVGFIKYVANNWSLPMPTKDLQFPQQPLYYFISAAIYDIGMKLGLSSASALFNVGYFSLFCSLAFLYYSYKLISLLTQNKWTGSIALSFIAFTPSFVYLCARINNDSLTMALSVFSLYYIVKSCNSNFSNSFYPALIGTSLLFLTKVTASTIEILFFTLLIVSYIQNSSSKQTNKLKERLYVFGTIGIFLLGFTLLRTYLPIEDSFHMVNSSNAFPGQIIKSLDFSYFASFNIYELIQTGYSHVFGEDAIRYSFSTYQYGTMFFGEFKYASYIANNEWFKKIMQVILALGLIYPLAFIIFTFKLYRSPILYKLLYATVILNLILILNFISSYSVVCNTDFRYFTPSFVLFAFIFAQGLEYLSYNKLLKYIVSTLLILLALSEVLFFVLLLK